MRLITKELEEKIKQFPLGCQDEKLGRAEVIVKFFNPTGIGTWYITEGEKIGSSDYELFGYCHLGDDDFAEFGTIYLSELENLKLPMGMSIEQDLYIPKGINLIEALKRDNIKVPDYLIKDYEENHKEKGTKVKEKMKRKDNERY